MATPARTESHVRRVAEALLGQGYPPSQVAFTCRLGIDYVNRIRREAFGEYIQLEFRFPDGGSDETEAENHVPDRG